jgi:hypothetical protein
MRFLKSAPLTLLRSGLSAPPCPVQEENGGFETLQRREDAASLGGKPFMTVACRIPEDHRNRFIRFGLYSGMRFFLDFFVLMTAQAMNLKDFNAKPDKEQSACVAAFIDKMATDLRAKNPQLATDIRTCSRSASL